MASLGIIGQGSFGTFAAAKLADRFEITTYEKGESDQKFQQVARCDYVMLAVPLGAYEEVLPKLKESIRSDAVILDISSVKERPIELITRFLPGQSLVAAHPLFGPESAANSLAGHTLIFCPTPHTSPELLLAAKEFCTSLGLEVRMMSAEEHDELMADLQGITFFLAQALVEYGITERPITTPSFDRLLYLAELEKHHSPELFETIQKGNAFIAKKRRRLLEVMEAIAARLEP